MGNTFFDNGLKENCNGCGVCALVCPKKCINMVEDEEGFLYPEIDKEKCINCGKCKRSCSNIVEKNKYVSTAYMAKNRNDEQRINSTSGGMFKVLAEYVIKKDGIVFGVDMGDDFIARHSYAETIEDCKRFSYSKYVRSNLGSTYDKVKEFLVNNRMVLFTGTPCQAYGLRKFLNKEYDNLIICEIICHANPSPKVLDLYLKNCEKNHKSKVKSIFFRGNKIENYNKAYVEFENGKRFNMDSYINAFSSEQLINRPSCNSCQFVTENRNSDFTIGDFWGIEKVCPEFKDEKGISLITVNTEKAQKVFKEIENNLRYKECDLKEAFSYNHHTNLKQSENRETFFNGISSGEINESNIISYMEKYTKKSFFVRLKRKLKKYIIK